MNKQSDIDVVVELAKQDLFNIIGIKQDLEEQLSNCRYDQIWQSHILRNGYHRIACLLELNISQQFGIYKELV